MSNPLAIIQARIESTRLPGKVLKEIGGHPLIEHVVRRTHRAIPNPVLAIPDTSPNDELEERATDWPCHIVRGSEEDVLDRFKRAMDQFPEADPILRVTGDNPLISPRLMERLTGQLSGADWASWLYLPFGVGNSVYTRDSILEAHDNASSPRDREHVTLYIRRNNDYRVNRAIPPEPYRAPGFRLTVDTPEDLELIRKLHDELATDPFGTPVPDVIEHLAQRPDLISINHSTQQEIYEPIDRILYTFNQGGEWGSGHRARYRVLKQSIDRHNNNTVQLQGLTGNVLETSSDSDEIIGHFKNPLNRSIIEIWARRIDANIVVQDIKHSDEQLIHTLKEEGSRVIGIEDRGPGRKDMDAVVDPNIYDDTLADDRVSPDNRYYGPDYALINPMFREHRRDDPPSTLEKMGLFFGGTDPGHLGPSFLDVALERLTNVELHYFGPHRERVDKLTTNRRNDENTVVNRGFVENSAKAFSEMDLMVIAGGIVKFEVACLNIPAVIIPQNEEQHDNSQRFIAKNLLNWPLLKTDSSREDWRRLLTESPPDKSLAEWSNHIKDVVDGRGLERFYRIVQDILKRDDSS